MDARSNPYSPGAGVRPAELAGRDQEIESFAVLRHRAANGRSAQSIIFSGLRGVGKTVLLRELHASAEEDGWITAIVEADQSSGRSPFRSQVASALNASLRRANGSRRAGSRLKAALRTFRSFSLTASPDGSLSIGIDLEPQPGRADTGSMPTDLSDLAIDLGDAARELGVGAALFVDEMQHLTEDDLAAICQACHLATQRNLPFFVIGAGLPNLPGALAEAKSYAERLFLFTRIDRLDPAAARLALTRPASDEGVDWADAAAQQVLDAADGYPYFIQQFGKTTWDAAIASPIATVDAQQGIRTGKALLDQGFFRARWDRATPSEREYLRAMSSDGDGPSSTGEIAQRLGKKPTSLGPARANLIAKGLVYAPEHGQIAFTVPGMADFIAREIEG
jgi:hypothetical protein